MSKNFEQLFFFSDFFDIFSKKVNFSKTIRYFFLVVSLPLRSLLQTFSDKNSKKIKIFKFVKKFRTTFFSQWFFRFFEVCSSSNLVNFLEVCGSFVFEEILLFAISGFFFSYLFSRGLRDIRRKGSIT